MWVGGPVSGRCVFAETGQRANQGGCLEAESTTRRRWELEGNADSLRRPKILSGKLVGGAKFVDGPLGQAVELDGRDDAVVVPRDPSMNVGAGDFHGVGVDSAQ